VHPYVLICLPGLRELRLCNAKGTDIKKSKLDLIFPLSIFLSDSNNEQR